MRLYHLASRCLSGNIATVSKYQKRLTTTDSTMVLKRKRLGEEDASPQSELPRRSSREKKEAASDSPKERNDHTPEDGLIIEDRKNHRDPTRTQHIKEGIERALHNLDNMEQKLRSAAKRQRMEIESSDLSSSPGLSAAFPMTANDAVSGKTMGVGTSPLNAPMGQKEADLAADDNIDTQMEESIERGARRPPPVHSKTLPLPWAGRLGYVSHQVEAPETSGMAGACRNCC